MNYESRAQSLKPSDTICPTVRVYQNLLIGAKQSVELKGTIKDLEDRISTLKGVIADLQSKDSVTISTYGDQIFELNNQVWILEKLLRKERRKRVVTGIIGIATTAGAFFIGSGLLK